MKLILLGLIALICSTLVGCQSPPTRASELDSGFTKRAFKDVKIGENKKFNLSKAIIIDTRPRFQFELSRTPRSYHFYWKDWQLFQYSGVQLIKQKNALQRRLARKGINPDTDIIIFGDGRNGVGEEYYLAALLFSLGLNKITVTGPKTFSGAIKSRQANTVRSVAYWKKPLRYNFSCRGRKPGHRIVVMSVKTLLDSKFLFNKRKILKNAKKDVVNSIEVSGDLFAYGMAMTMLQSNYEVCVDGV